MATRAEIEARVAEKLRESLRRSRFDPQGDINNVLRDIVAAIRSANPGEQRRLVAFWQKNQSADAGELLSVMINNYLTGLAEQEAKQIPDPCIGIIDKIL